MAGTLKVGTITTPSGSGSITIPSGVTLSGGGTGITQADQWRLTADVTLTADTDTLITGWERNDNASYGYLGSGMTESSGIFTFPETGIYLIINLFDILGINTNSDYASTKVLGTTDNSTYNFLNNNNQWSETSRFSTGTNFNIFNVTDTSTHKIKLFGHAQGTAKTLRGNSTMTETQITFIRLGA